MNTHKSELPQRKSIRLKGYDYSRPGAYFVTICTQDRECLLGKCNGVEFYPSEAGCMVEKVWKELPLRLQHVETDAFVVMPNHVHGVILIQPKTRRGDPCDRPGSCNDPDAGESCLRPYDRRQNGTLPGSLGRILQAFKSITTGLYIGGVNDLNWPPFHGRLWQRNYYERVIRDEKELGQVREYIVNNPANWDKDEENPGCMVS